MPIARLSLAFALACLLPWCSPAPGHTACQGPPLARGWVPFAHAATADATIQYFGHNFFQITSSQGTSIVTDPLAPGWYPTPTLHPHVVTVGREHPHHNYVQLAQGTPIILRGLARAGADWQHIRTQVREVGITSVPIYQHGVVGALKGAAFLFDFGGLCLVHLGDLSHRLTDDQLQAIGRVDVAFIPIDGTYTMDAATAREVLQQLSPKLAIPMHYRDDRARVEILARGLPTRWLAHDTLLVHKAALPAVTEIVVLTPHGARP